MYDEGKFDKWRTRYTTVDTVTLIYADYIAVTNRPGLTSSLREGCSAAYSLARENNTPIISVHHMQAHATMPMLENKKLKFPYLCLLISGGLID